MSRQKLIHQKKSQQAVYVNLNVRASRSRAVYRRRRVPLCVKKNHSSTAGLTLETDSSSMLQIYVGFRAGGLRWCIAVRTVLLYMLSRKAKSSWISMFRQDLEDNRATRVSEQSSVATEYTWLAAILWALATSQLGRSWVGRWNGGLVLCCGVLCGIQLQWSLY